MKQLWNKIGWLVGTVLGSAAYGVCFAFFLNPNNLNAGGISGLAQIIYKLTGFGSVGLLTVVINLPLFALAGIKIGKKFFFGSLVGMGTISLMIDFLSVFEMPQFDPLLSVIYSGVISGIGLGFMYVNGTSTGGSDIIVRLVKLKARNVPIGRIAMTFDMIVVILTGIVNQNVENALYTGISVFLTGKMIDAVVYGFDYSKVALIVTKEYEKVAREIGQKLNRGATFLHSQGAYTLTEGKVVLVVVKRQQITDLKQLVVEIDPNAFIIVQEAHQVLGEGFARHTKDSL